MEFAMLNRQSVSVYTVVSILRNMRRSLGLEAMSEFLDMYVEAVDRKDPQLKSTLQEALSERAIDQFYQAVVNYEKK